MLYFDYAASAPPYEDVIRTVSEVMKLHYGNASSIHAYGENAGRLLNKSRSVCAGLWMSNRMKLSSHLEPRRVTTLQ